MERTRRPGWYQDPTTTDAVSRYWDGVRWTQELDPPFPAPRSNVFSRRMHRKVRTAQRDRATTARAVVFIMGRYDFNAPEARSLLYRLSVKLRQTVPVTALQMVGPCRPSSQS